MIFTKLMIMNYVLQLQIAISVQLILIVDGVGAQENASQEIWSIHHALNLVSMAGFSEKELALIKLPQEVFQTSHLK